MKKLLMVLVVLAIVAGMSFALEVGGSSAITGYGNADAKTFEADQEIDIDLDALHFDVNGGLDLALPGKDWCWDYELGASYVLSAFTFGGTIAGDSAVKLGTMTVSADFVVDSFGINSYLELSANKAVNFYRGVDVSIFFNPGPAELRFGMTYLDEIAVVDDVGYSNAPAAVEGFGIYGSAKISY